MNSGRTLSEAMIRIDADTSSAIIGLKRVSSELNSLVPGGNAVASVFERIQGGFLQLIQGLSRNVFQSVTSSMSKMVSSGLNVAKTIEMARVSFDNLLESGEDVDALLLKIQEDAATTPFDTDALTLSTQKIALITKNGAQAEKTILSLGKALAAAGRGTAEMNRMATNLQQIGTNAKATERDLKEFGNAGIDIVGIVTEFSDEFKEAGIKATEARDWLKTIDTPFEVIVNALNNAGDSVEGFANIYTEGAQTIGQAMENMSDSVGIFSYRVMQQATILDRAKNIMKDFQEGLFLDKTFTANTAQAISHLFSAIKEANIVQPIISKIKEVMSAFASGQFDNVIVFFKSLFNALKNFSGIKFVSNFFKTIVDLFSDNHTAEEVAKVATQLGNLIRAFLELKMVSSISNYFFNLTESLTTMGLSVVQMVRFFTQATGAMTAFRSTTLMTIGIVGAIVAALAIFSNISGKGIEDVLESIISGIQNLGKILIDAAKNMLNFGWNIIVGLYNGLVKGFNAIIGKVKEMAQAIIDTFKNVFKIASPSKVMRDEVGNNIALGIAIGIREKYGEILDAAEEVLEELVDLQDDYVKELSNFGAIDLVQQVQVYKDFARLYREGTRARLEMDDKVHSAESSIIKEMIDLIDDYNTTYDKAYKTAKDYYDMFEYTQVTLTRTTKSVIEGLHRQNDNMTKYYDNIYKMSQMGFDDDFMAYVYEQGIDAASEVAGLADATSEQIEEINELWKTRGAVAAKIATLNTRKLKEETIEELDYLQTGLETKVLDYYDSGTYLVYNFTRGIYDMIPSLEQAMMRVSDTARSASSAASSVADSMDAAISEQQLDEVSDFTAAAKKMNIELFDTNDIFSFMKNLLSGMPWWAWAAIGVKAVTGVVSAIELFQRKASQASKGVRNIGQKIGNFFKRTTEESYDFSKSSEKAAAVFQQSGDKISGAAGKVSDSVSNSYHRTTTEVQKAAKKTSDITYSSSGKIGANLLRPFKEFNTKVKGFTNSITHTIKSFLEIIVDTIKNVINMIIDIIRTAVKGVFNVAKDLVNGIINILKQSVKGISEVLNMIVKEAIKILQAGVKGILKVVDTAVTGAVKIIKKAAKGVGEALRDLLKPLSNKNLLMGVVVLEGLALVLFTLAKAGQEFDKVSWEGLGKLAIVTVALLGVSKIMQFLGGAAKEILLGAAAVAAAGAAIGIALAAIGGGLTVLSWSIAEVSRYGQQIDLGSIMNMVEAWAILGGLLSLTIGVNILGAISGLFAMAEGGELVVVAKCFAEVSKISAKINPNNLKKLVKAIAAVGLGLSLSTVTNIVGAFSGLFSMVVSGEMLPTSENLAKVSKFAEQIRVSNFEQLRDAIWMIGGTLTLSTVHNFISIFSGAFAAIVSQELLPIARGLSQASVLAENIDVENLKKIEKGISTLASQMMWDLVQNFVSMFSGSFGAVVSQSLVPIVKGLAEASEEAKDINTDNLDKVSTVLKSMHSMDLGGVLQNLGKAWASGPLIDVANNVVSIIKTVKEMVAQLQSIETINEEGVVGDVKTIVSICEHIASAFDGNFFLAIAQNWQSSNLEGVTDSVKRIMDELDEILLQLKRVKMINRAEVTSQIQEVQGIAEALGKVFDGNFFEAIFEKWSGSKVADTAESIKRMLDTTLEIMKKLKEVTDALPKDVGGMCYTIEGYLSQVEEVVKAIDETFNGDWAGAQADKSQSSSLADVAQNLDWILGHVQSMFHKLQEFGREGYNVDKLAEPLGNVTAVVQAIATMKLQDGDKAVGEADLTSMSNKTSSLAAMGQNLDWILGHVQSMCHKLQEFDREGYATADAVKEQIGKIEQIVWRIADIQFSQTGDEVEATANKAASLSEVSKNLSSILSTTLEMCNNLKAITDAGWNVGDGNDKDVLLQITNVEKIVAAFAQIKIDQDGQYVSDLASKVSTIKEMATHLNELITTTTAILESLKAFSAAYEGTTVEEQVKKINEEILGPLMGGVIGDKEFTGIQIPYAAFSQDDVDRLGMVKSCLEQISAIAQVLKTVEDVAEYILNVEKIITFINDTMSQVPEKIAAYSEDFKNQGIDMARAFISGWETEFAHGEEAAHNMQYHFWQTLENLMPDEAQQGKTMAVKFLEGWLSVVTTKAAEAGHMMQDAVWHAIENRMGDMWQQGNTMANQFVGGWQDVVNNNAETLGSNMVSGVAKGMSDNMWKINRAAGELSQVAINKLKQLLDIHSPSKVMAEIGGYVAQGFAEGITDDLAEVESAGEALAKAVMDGYNSEIQPLSISAYEARGIADRTAYGYGVGGTRNTSVVQNNNIYNNMDMSQALSQIAWEVSRS